MLKRIGTFTLGLGLSLLALLLMGAMPGQQAHSRGSEEGSAATMIPAAFAAGQSAGRKEGPPSEPAIRSLPAVTPRSPTLYGVINDDGQHYADEWARGVRATTFELHWMHYEPQEGVYNLAYIEQMQKRLAGLKAQG
ncbi:MAG: hypothetical protein PVF77_17030, partial [Anaerolineae bacterium]